MASFVIVMWNVFEDLVATALTEALATVPGRTHAQMRAHLAGQYANADHYQMLTYCAALEVPRAWLIYAGGGEALRVRRIKNAGVEVVECALDVGSSPDAILRRLSRIAEAATPSTTR